MASSRLGIHAAINDPWNTRLNNGPSAHGARFQPLHVLQVQAKRQHADAHQGDQAQDLAGVAFKERGAKGRDGGDQG